MIVKIPLYLSFEVEEDDPFWKENLPELVNDVSWKLKQDFEIWQSQKSDPLGSLKTINSQGDSLYHKISLLHEREYLSLIRHIENK